MTEQEFHFNEGMLHAYDLMDRTISGAIKRNGGATTALQIINVFNEFTSHLHYQKSLTDDRLSEWQERVEEECCEDPNQCKELTFASEIGMLEHLLHELTILSVVKGGN